jgi:hypothetical protein
MRNKMGLNFATDLSDLDMSIENQISVHLQYNCYPPVPSSMVQPCVDAINAVWNEDYFAEIELPEGVLWRGETFAPASAIVEGHRLDGFVMEEDWEDE